MFAYSDVSHLAVTHIGHVLPAVGYDAGQLAALADTINRSDAEVAVVATPIDLGRLMRLEKPAVRARYEFADAGEPTLGALVDRFVVERLPKSFRRLTARPFRERTAGERGAMGR